MKLVNATVSLYRVPTHMKQPISNALQRIEAVELVVVRLFADNGVDGWGYTYTIGKGGSAIKCILETELVPLVMGENPLNSERIWQKLWWVCRVISRAGITTMGIAAIDNALWDLKGKHFGEPLYRLLGGYRDRVPAYAMDSGWMDLSLEEMKSLSKKLVKEGFKGVKIKVGRESSEQDLERVKEARSAVGNNVQVMIDANGRFTIDEATRLTNLLKDFDISWFEEPLHYNQPQAHAILRSKSPIPIALGESFYSKYEFKDYIEQKAVDIVQPDAGRLGITEWMKVASLAECWGLPVAPHAFADLHAHLVAAIPNGLTVEYSPTMDAILEKPVTVQNGYIELPQTPGHGMQLSEEKSAALLVDRVEIVS